MSTTDERRAVPLPNRPHARILLAMGLLSWIFGSDKPSRWADPNCPWCHGRGRLSFGTGIMESCHCVQRNVGGLLYQAEVEREQLARMQVPETPEQADERRRRLFGQDDEFDVPGETNAWRQNHSDGIDRLRALNLRQDEQVAMVAHDMSICCKSKPCVCGQEHWWTPGEWG